MHLITAFVLAAAATAVHAAASAPAHAASSTDWRDQIIYFVVTDRFADGDPRNNDQGAGEYDPASPDKYHGGDLAGLTARLEYIRGLGATALWITPPVANQWTDPHSGHTGYHGYWGEHFKKVDKHLGTLDDYRRLGRALHARGMRLVQDIVLNHTGNFFGYQGGWDAGDPARFLTLNRTAKPGPAPSQAPLHLNDPRLPAHRRAGIYHWTPDVADYSDPRQEQTFQMSGLDDLNTENPAVRRLLRDSYGWWIREVGVDAFRVDTAFYVPPELFADFLHSRDRRAPGIATVARRAGRPDFHVFGEGFGIDKAYADTAAAKIERYMSGPGGQPLLPGMLNFPLYGSLGDVFARGRPTAELGWRIERMVEQHPRVHWMPTFVDNHDVDRFLAGGSAAALKQSLLAILTLPGIPTIYYGTEQGFTEPRAAMFARGAGSGGRDRFDREAPLYRFVAEASALRRTHPLFSRGTPKVLKDNAAAAGALAWRMDWADRRGGSALVVFNTADGDALLDNLDTGLPAGTRLQGLFGIDGRPTDVVVGDQGRITMKLAPRSGLVWKVGPREAGTAAAPAIGIDALPAAALEEDFEVSGRTPPGIDRISVVVDGDLGRAQSVVPGPDGRWRAVVDSGRMADPAARHSVVAWDAASGAVSPTREFRIRRAWRVLADLADPAGDDHGPGGRYVYPTDSGWGSNRQMDLRHVKVSAAGAALRLDLTTARLTTLWNPANGFDHVAFTIFIELPGQDGGSRVMPLQNGELPAGMRWHRRLRVHGWSNALFTSDGASATSEGTPAAGAAQIVVDAASHTLGLILPASALGGLTSLAGARLYVTTWDYDGGYRALEREPRPHSIGGGDPASGARVMDDTPVITLQ